MRSNFHDSSHACLLGHLVGMKYRSDRIIAWAIAVSLAVHLVLAFAVRNVQPVQAHEEPTPSPVHIVIIPPPTPKPTPQPHVPPATPTKPTTNTRPHVHAPVINDPRGPSGIGPNIGRVDPGPTGDPSPPGPQVTDLPKPACSNPNAPAATVNVMSPTTPEDATGEVGMAQIRVTLTPSGAVSAAELFRSAGNMLLDRAAIAAARQTTYRAAVRDCISVGGSYLFTVNFTQ
jgi:TonB family protein